MKVVFFWSNISGYMAACWRALIATGEVDLYVYARASGGSAEHAHFSRQVMDGIPHALINSDATPIEPLVRAVLAARKPDIIVLNGWHTAAYRDTTRMPEAASARFVMAMDTPFSGSMRQRYGRFVMRRYFSRIDRVVVAGERAYQLARTLGFAERQIRRGVYGADFEAFAPLLEQRIARPGGWPRRFLTAARLVDDKAIDIQVEAYKRYRTLVDDPWTMTFCGTGPLASLLKGVEGVDHRGFVQPADLPAVMAEHGAFVLASRYEPWGVAIAEACAAGLPIACSEACGASIELVRYCYNGTTFQTEDVQSLTDALVWMHKSYADLPEMGRASRDFAAAYSDKIWARRWLATFREALAEPRRSSA